jgi:glutamyl-Q tRNA(Asp) synthetase
MYCGRYAPSPTGDLHLGNALAAVVAVARAQQQRGICKLRIEDLDAPRCLPDGLTRMQQQLDALGLRFDGEVMLQSTRHDAYRFALDQLRQEGFLYACQCSRKDLVASAPHAGDEGPLYAGTCRDKGLPFDDPALPVAWRMRMPDATITVDDVWQGRFAQNPARDVGDIVLLRKDGVFAYQLAVVVDDAAQGVTEVVRAVDLLPSAPRQIVLHQALSFAPPRFAHLPMLVDEHGARISKRTHPHGATLPVVLSQTHAADVLARLCRSIGVGADTVDRCAALLDHAQLSTRTAKFEKF